MLLAVDTSTPNGSAARQVSRSRANTRAARAADQADQLGLVDAAVLLDVEQRFAEQLVGDRERPRGNLEHGGGDRAAGRRG